MDSPAWERCSAPGDAGAQDTGTVPGCRSCGDPAAWSWSFTGEPHLPDGGAWRGQDDRRVCRACQELTVAGDDVGLLDRAVPALGRRAAYPFAAGFVRQLEAARLAHGIARRTTYGAVRSDVSVTSIGRS